MVESQKAIKKKSQKQLTEVTLNNFHVTIKLCIHNMLSGGNQTNGNSLERFLTPYQHSRLPLTGTFHLEKHAVETIYFDKITAARHQCQKSFNVKENDVIRIMFVKLHLINAFNLHC